jgi:PleD family two-component response regulator
MTSRPVRDRLKDPLLTSQNSVVIIIDDQPAQIAAIASMDRRAPVQNNVSAATFAQILFAVEGR